MSRWPKAVEGGDKISVGYSRYKPLNQLDAALQIVDLLNRTKPSNKDR
jgi:hypothetical protein